MSTEVHWPENAPEEVRMLGKPAAFFKGGAATFALLLIVGILGILLAAGIAVALLIIFDERLVWKTIKLMVFAVGLLVASGAVIAKALTMRGLRVFVGTDGLARQQREKVEVMRWDEMNQVVRKTDPKSQEFTIRSPVQLLLKARDGREWVFDERLSGLRELRQLVEERTLPWMLPPAIEAFDAGESIGFGEVYLDNQGLHQGTSSVQWDILDEAKAEQGELMVSVQGSRKPIWRRELANVPNAHVLLALVEHARAHHT